MVQKIGIQSQVESYQRLKIWYLMLNTQHYKVRIKVNWSNSGNGLVPSPRPQCSAIEKGAFWSPSTKVTNFNFYLYIFIYAYIYLYTYIFRVIVFTPSLSLSLSVHMKVLLYIHICFFNSMAWFFCMCEWTWFHILIYFKLVSVYMFVCVWVWSQVLFSVALNWSMKFFSFIWSNK